MKCSIIGLGTASPPESVTQADALAMSSDVICEDARQERMLRMLFRKAGVESRRTVIPWQSGYAWKAMKQADPSSVQEGGAPVKTTSSVCHGPTTAERGHLYREFAPPLAIEAARNALDNASLDPQKITHLVTVSCTGMEAPGVDLRLIDELPLPPTVQRVNVGFMGCHGAINGLRTARGLAAADPNANVLVCCVELCSLHYRMTWDAEGVIGNALFADGAAAMIFSGENAIGPISQGELCDTAACLISDSADEMSWRVGDHGFEMRLTGRVPELIGDQLRPWLDSWLASNGLTVDQVGGWAVHPGGPRILDAVEQSANLDKDALRNSRGVLRELGNMSSPTVMFVLQRLLQENIDGPIVMLAFGPGLMAEAALLRF